MKRSRFSESQIIRILNEADGGRKGLLTFAVSTALAKLPITFGSPNTMRWRFRIYAGLKELEKENSKLERMFANLVLKLDTQGS